MTENWPVNIESVSVPIAVDVYVRGEQFTGTKKMLGFWSCEEVEDGSQLIKRTRFTDENSDNKGMYNSWFR